MSEEREYTTQSVPWVRFHHDPADVQVHGESVIGTKVTVSNKDGVAAEYIIYDVVELENTADITKYEYKLRPVLEFGFGPDDDSVKRVLMQNLLQRQPPLWKIPDDPFEPSAWLQRPTLRERLHELAAELGPIKTQRWLIGDPLLPKPADGRPPVPKPSTTPPMWANNPTQSRRRRNR